MYTYKYVYTYRSYDRHARSRPPARCWHYRGPFPVARRWMTHELTYDESRNHSLSVCQHYSRRFSSHKWRNKSRNHIWSVTHSHMMSHELTLSDGSVAVFFQSPTGWVKEEEVEAVVNLRDLDFRICSQLAKGERAGRGTGDRVSYVYIYICT